MSDPTFADQFPHGLRCGCDCGCGRVLGEGDWMARPHVGEERDWSGEVLQPRVDLIVCVDCLVGSHRPGDDDGHSDDDEPDYSLPPITPHDPRWEA